MALSNEMVDQDKMAIKLPPKRATAAVAPSASPSAASAGGGSAGWQSGALRLYSFDPESCRQDLTRRLTELKAHCSARGDRLLGAVMFTCGGRTNHFFGEPAFDANCFAKIMTGVPLIGMYAGGEIGPPLLAEAPPERAFQVGGAGMHGFTAIFGMFVVPERQPRTTQLAFPEGDEGAMAIAQAYAELRASAPPCRLPCRPPLPPPPPPPPWQLRCSHPASRRAWQSCARFLSRRSRQRWRSLASGSRRREARRRTS